MSTKIANLAVSGAVKESEIVIDFGVSSPFTGIKINSVRFDAHLSGGGAAGIGVTTVSPIYAGLSFGKIVGKGLVPHTLFTLERAVSYGEVLGIDCINVGGATLNLQVDNLSGFFDVRHEKAGTSLYLFLASATNLASFPQPYDVDVIIDFDYVKLSQNELLAVLQLEASSV